MTTALEPELERALIAEARTNPDAFRPLYRHYFPRVYAYIVCRVGTQADAEDIVADVFLRVVRSLGQFEYRGEGAFSAWLFRIAHNRLARHYAAVSRANHISLDALPDGGDALRDVAANRHEETFLLRNLIAELSPRRQEVILLRYAAGLSNREIAAVLALDERTVASHLSRAIDDLRRKYHEEPSA